MSLNLWAEINEENVKHNISLLKDFVPDVAIMAVVKADAYGHGLLEFSSLIHNDIDYFAVTTLREAVCLRNNGCLKPILILGPLLYDEYEDALNYDCAVTVSSLEYAQSLNEVALRNNKKIKIHIKVDTGMGRWGLVYKNAYLQIQKIVSLSNLYSEGLFTHFSVADNKLMDYTERQIELFKLLLDELSIKDIAFKYVHSANSAAIVNYPESHFNMIRPGLMLYGYLPFRETFWEKRLKPVLTIKSRVMFIKQFVNSRAISYGRNYFTGANTEIAIVPIGYGHGYPYALNGKASVLINGKRFNVAGNICMDYIMVDLGDEKGVEVGDEVIIIGNVEEEKISAYELADKSGTVCYEVLTGLSGIKKVLV